MTMHLAQLNIGYPNYDLDDPRMAGFMDNIDRINGLGQKMPGFVWMLTEETGGATGIETPWRGNVIANLTVWESAEQLEHFVWNTVHKQIYNQKKQWFEALKTPHFVMWWIEEGHIPTLIEAKQRLDQLQTEGNSDEAFGWSHLPHVKLWQTQKCG